MYTVRTKCELYTVSPLYVTYVRCVVCVQNVYTNLYSSSTAAWHGRDVAPPRLGLHTASHVARVPYVRAGSPAMTLETERPEEYLKRTINITVNIWLRCYFTKKGAYKCAVRLMIS